MASHLSSPPVPPPPASATRPWLVEGPLVVTTVADWHRRLADQIHLGAELDVDLSGVTAADAFGLQLLIAARRGAAERGSTLRIIGLSAAIGDACASTGLPPTCFTAPLS